MSKIRVLPEILANKIAAGEIVERPASVVKELLENSVDAGAHSIHIVVEAGGKKSIQVRDDGEGMSQDDAILAFEHHATSKLHTAEDLAAISTLGFRGEALPSIASICRLTLRTRAVSEGEEIAGTELEIQGGQIRSVKTISWDRGTEVSVRDLFYNVPARRKFLRSHDTELGHITRLVTHYALAHPEIRYSLISERRSLLEVVPVGTVRERVYQLFGEDFLKNLVELSGHSGAIHIHGFVSQPHEQRTNPYSQFFYVNRRMVRDRVIASAVRQAYRHAIPASAYPVVLLFLEIPYDEVDVNAHPAKIEIRFRQQSAVYDLIRDSVQRALVQGRSIPHYNYQPDNRDVALSAAPLTDVPLLAGADLEKSFELTTTPPAAPDALQRAFNYPVREMPQMSGALSQSHSSLRVNAGMLLGSPSGSFTPFQAAGVRILGQMHESYIIAADSQGLLIVDQHVAHERVLYERYASAIQRGSVEAQGLLLPVSIQLSPHQMATLECALTDLNSSGFQVEPFGGNAVLIRSIPALAGSDDCAKLLSEILEGIEAEERSVDVERIRDRIAVSTACRSAIKVHTPLAPEKMQWLLDELGKTRIPTNCPHGRPIILRFSLYEIERNFGRI